MPHQSKDVVCIEMQGPPVRLSAKVALALSMAFHELATNAAKYGALSKAEGRALISWHIETDNQESSVVIEWREVGGPIVKPPTRRGFGSRLIERGLAQELGGRARIDYHPGGVTCEIVSPLRLSEAVA